MKAARRNRRDAEGVADLLACARVPLAATLPCQSALHNNRLITIPIIINNLRFIISLSAAAGQRKTVLGLVTDWLTQERW